MQMQRTTLRIRKELKKAAERYILEKDLTLQDIFNNALQEYLDRKSKVRANKLIIKTHDLGSPLDNLTRKDLYE